MINKKLLAVAGFMLMFCKLSAQNMPGSDHLFYRDRVLPAPESVFKKFTQAGMSPTNHVLTVTEQEIVERAFSILPTLYKKLLKEHLHSISFMDNMPNTALTSSLGTADSVKQFNITFRAGILNETVSAWAGWKEKSVFDNSANPGTEIFIDAGNLEAIQYVLIHEATHVVDAVLGLTPHAELSDSSMSATAFTKNIWRLFNVPEEKYRHPLLEQTRFRSGTVQPVSSAREIYHALEQTPFSSLYGMASCYEDIAELISIYHLTHKLHQPFVIYIKEAGKITALFEPMKNKPVRKRLKQLHFLYK